MLGNQDRYDDIDRYVTGRMTPDEREAFIHEVEQDPTLKASLHLVEDICDGLERRQEKIDKIKAWQEDNNQKSISRTNVIKWSTVSIAAAVVMGVFISYPTSYSGLQDHGFETEVSTILRSTGDFNLVTFWEAEEYEGCLIAIKEEIDSYQRAIDSLDPENIPDEEYQDKMQSYNTSIDDLQWANIQTLLKMRRYDVALSEVESYISSDGFRKEKAQKLYKRLKRKLR